MPELPEVETVTRDLQVLGFVGSTIERVEVLWPKAVSPMPAEDFCRHLEGSTITQIARRAKYLILSLSSGYHLTVHLRMTGKFFASLEAQEGQKHDRVRFFFKGGRALHFNDTRKFGRLQLTVDPSSLLAHIGPEPLDPALTPEAFAKSLASKRKPLKALLLDQTFLAGLGNIYVDEALWLARLHPQRLASSLKVEEATILLSAVRSVLQAGIERGGTSLGTGKGNFHSLQQGYGRHQDLLEVYKRRGHPCSRCQSPIERIVLAQRSTHFCSHCQKMPFNI